MKEGFRQCAAWLHTWTGLIVGWVLFFVFATGTAGYFYHEIDRWMRPELPLRSAMIPPERSISFAQARLQERAPGADSWTIYLPGSRANAHLSIQWRDPPKPGEESRGFRGRGRFGGNSEIIDVATGASQSLKPRETGGGFLLYRMHYRLHYLPTLWAYYLVGVCTMIMFIAILSGIVTHKKIFKDFFTFRPAKGQRSWLDFHNVLSVTALPFFILITYSGLLFFTARYLPVAEYLLIGGEPTERRFREEREPRSGEMAALTSLHAVLGQAERAWGAGQVERLSVQYPGDRDARITVFARPGRHLTGLPAMRFDGVTGAKLESEGEHESGMHIAFDTMLALHEGIFAPVVVRWLYFASGVLGCAMIATGLVLWTVKRRPQRMKEGGGHFGHALVERLNVGTIAGLPVAVAIYFLANRLLAADLPGRRDWEVHAMFAAWLCMLIYPVVRPIWSAWVEELRIAAGLFALLPVVNALTTDRHLGVTLRQGDWPLAAFDLTSLGFAVVFAIAASKVARRAAVADSAHEPMHTRQSHLMPERAESATEAEVSS